MELAALLVGRWRSLRTGGRAGRDKLRRASLILAMVLALGQALVATVAYENDGAIGSGAGARIITVMTLLGATAGLIALARIVDEEGLGGGFPILVLAFALPDIAGPLGQACASARLGGVAASALLTGVFGLALLVGVTLWFFSPYCLPGSEPWEHPALVSRPACGVAPLSTVPGMLTVVTGVLSLYSSRRPVLPWQFDLLPLVLGVIAAIGFVCLFNLPERLRAVWRALSPLPPERLPRLKSTMVECVLFVGLAFVAPGWLVRTLGSANAPRAIPVILLTGIMADLIGEWRARAEGARLVPIWEIHQVYAVPPTMLLLRAQGFHPFAKGLRLRSLLQFFGPYAPIEILVPAGEAQPAYALLASRWPTLDGPKG